MLLANKKEREREREREKRCYELAKNEV